MAYISRMTRVFMLHELGQEYVVTARVKGVPEWRIIWFHALRNAAVPLVTVIALSYAGLLEGSVLTETVFAWPGLGQYLTNSLQNARHERGAGLHAGDRRDLRQPEPAVGPALHAARPARPAARMTELSRRDWLLSDRPGSRRQARLGQAYRTWLAFRSNRLAMVGLGIVLLLIVMAIFADVIAPYDPLIGGDLRTERLLPPSWEHWMGTDEQARDIWSRLVYGSRLTLMVVALVAVIATPIGLLVGTTAGYFGGWVDTVLMRLTDIFLAFPRLILALAFVAALGPGHRERDHRHRAHVLAALRPPRARRDADDPRRRLHRGDPASGRAFAADHLGPRGAALPLLGRGAGHARHGRHHPDRRGSRVPRPRRAAAATGMGRDDRERPAVPDRQLVGGDHARASRS